MLEQEMEKVQMDLVALQEIRWLGSGTLEKKNCVIFLFAIPLGMFLAFVFMLTEDSYQISCVLNLLTIDHAGLEFVGNTEITVQIMRMPQHKIRMMKGRINFT